MWSCFASFRNCGQAAPAIFSTFPEDDLLPPSLFPLDAIAEFEAHGIKVSDRLFVQCQTPEEAVLDTHAIVVLTEWDCFKDYDYEKFFGIMQKPA